MSRKDAAFCWKFGGGKFLFLKVYLKNQIFCIGKEKE